MILTALTRIANVMDRCNVTLVMFQFLAKPEIRDQDSDRVFNFAPNLLLHRNNEYILRFDISVNDPQRMQMPHTFGDLTHDIQRIPLTRDQLMGN
ncbi:hypothetical protein WICPIJ_007435 [Wickerhamomyces pijperi]|uniref:Uncharacterized protein n=1 Tax=Wickerhamomyces pijperi TaxID=599730 RepID=A0A9P8TKE4_WICPI|nr:hypothetical protein WICPIJ_007435 [Wickerhamomyces pijperi]